MHIEKLLIIILNILILYYAVDNLHVVNFGCLNIQMWDTRFRNLVSHLDTTENFY